MPLSSEHVSANKQQSIKETWKLNKKKGNYRSSALSKTLALTRGYFGDLNLLVIKF